MANEKIEHSWIGRQIAGTYEIVERLAMGSHSQVFWGKHLAGGSDAAIKVMEARSEEPFASERLHREGTILHLLQAETGCPQLLGRTFADDGSLVLVLELLDGMSLEAMLARGERRLDLDELIGLFGPVIRTLSALHQKGIIHRDINPTNLFRSWDPPGLKLLGFGAAESTVSDAPSDAKRFGMPKYVAPEVWLGKTELDQRADIYSMAVVLFRCLAGRCPFESDSAVELVNVVPRAQRPSLVAFTDGLPPALDDWMTIALCPEREGRFENMEAMWAAFLRASGSSLPDSPSERERRQTA
jgi:serine/threonine-protein kinase